MCPGLEPGSSDIESDNAVNCVTTTAYFYINLFASAGSFKNFEGRQEISKDCSKQASSTVCVEIRL